MRDGEDVRALTRRALLRDAAGAAGAIMLGAPAAIGASSRTLSAAGRAPASVAGKRWHTIIIGAGVFGAWTAWHLQQHSAQPGGGPVLLLDAWGPAHARASSGGESRLTRALYGEDELYTRLAWTSLESWRALSRRSGLPIFHEIGALYLFRRMTAEITRTIELHKRLELPLELLDRVVLGRRYPQVDWSGIEFGLLEPEFGALMARRAVQTLVQEFVADGGTYRQVAIAPPQSATAQQELDSIATLQGERLQAEHFVFACGAWLPKLFPDLLGRRIHPTRQEVVFFTPPAGDDRFSPPHLPAWVDEESLYYGFPDLEGRGFKVASDRTGPSIDPDAGDRQLSTAFIADVRTFLQRRFPALAQRPISEGRVCQYESSANGDLLVDRHAEWSNVWLVGAGSGHGFKHGPAVGLYAADLVTGRLQRPEPRFSLGSKA